MRTRQSDFFLSIIHLVAMEALELTLVRVSHDAWARAYQESKKNRKAAEEATLQACFDYIEEIEHHNPAKAIKICEAIKRHTEATNLLSLKAADILKRHTRPPQELPPEKKYEWLEKDSELYKKIAQSRAVRFKPAPLGTATTLPPIPAFFNTATATHH